MDGTAYYVMPYVEGESFATALAREKQLPIDDAIRIAVEAASALDYAHRHGVIHRDIKPENILLHDGQVLVADFGIALAVSQAGGDTRLTETGMSLGTPYYMSPEQAMGERTVDARSDIYALGAVTYEMLTGEPPFTGPTAQAVVAKVMTGDPEPPSNYRRTVPPGVEEAVLTALQRLPADRYATAGEFGAALQAGRDEAPRPRRRRRAVRLAPAYLAGLGALALAALAGVWFAGRSSGRSERPALVFGRAHKVTYDPGLEVHPAISPDGKIIAYAAGNSSHTRIELRPVAGGRAIALSDDSTEVEANPRWSPDGTRLLFLARGGVFSAPAGGGSARQEIPAGRAGPVRTAAWSPDGKRIAFAVGDSLFIWDPASGAHPLARFYEPGLCDWSPTGGMIACASGNVRYMEIGRTFGNLSPSRVVVCRVSDGVVTTVTDSLSVNQSPVWAPDGRTLYFISNRDGPKDIYAVAITRRGAAARSPERLTTGLEAQSLSLSADGHRVAYSVYAATSDIWSLALSDSSALLRRESPSGRPAGPR